VSRLLRLYPRSWRERYGEEFLGLVLERPPSFADRVDIVRGAVDARLHPQLPRPDRALDRSGFAPLGGLVLLIAAIWIGANGRLQYDEYGTYRDSSAAAIPFLAAMGLLVFGIYRLMKRLPPESRGARACAWVAIGMGSLWSIMPWSAVAALPFLLGILGFAIGAQRVGVVSRRMMVGIVAVLVVPIALFVAMAVLPWYAFRESGLNLLVILAPLGGLYLLVGLGLLRGALRPAAS
jgi:hypothetical protein